jgi:hypothetical protein
MARQTNPRTETRADRPPSLRWLVLIALAGVFALVACSCGKDKAPLALDQRTLIESELPGFKLSPDPVQRWNDASKFAKDTHDVDIRATVEENIEQLQSGDFVAAIANSFGGLGRQTEAFSAAVQLGSPEAARDILEQRHQDYISPCPTVCTVSASEFEVSGIPNAKGVKRASEREHEGPPFEVYEVEFADGAFVYVVNVGGQPGTMSEDGAVSAANKLYDRVKGAPLAGS